MHLSNHFLHYQVNQAHLFCRLCIFLFLFVQKEARPFGRAGFISPDYFLWDMK